MLEKISKDEKEFEDNYKKLYEKNLLFIEKVIEKSEKLYQQKLSELPSSEELQQCNLNYLLFPFDTNFFISISNVISGFNLSKT